MPYSSGPMTTAIEIKVVSPVLVVSDVNASVAYFKDVLGFDVMFTFGEPTEYGATTRGDVQIHLSKDYLGGRVGKGGCYISMLGVDAIYAELKAKGVTIVEDIATRPYGMRDFYIADPDGNTIGFGEPVQE